MVKKTLETYECDVCGRAGERYTVGFPDGTLALDRCDDHDALILKMKQEKGTWTNMAGGGKAMFRISSPEDIEKQKKDPKLDGHRKTRTIK
jgi:hypothetical protein